MICPPDEAVREVLGLALAGSTWTGELDLGIDAVSGGATWWTPVWEAGEVVAPWLCSAKTRPSTSPPPTSQIAWAAGVHHR